MIELGGKRKAESTIIEAASMSRRKEIQMKGNNKNLVVFLMIATIIMFSAAAIAWDDDHDWNKSIEGKYAFAGVDFCFFAPGGFTNQFVPSLGLWNASTGTWEGVYVFHPDGRGEYKAKGGSFSVPGPGFTAGLTSANLDFKFRYTLDKGKITFNYELGSWVETFVYDPDFPPGQTVYLKIIDPWYGRISPDGRNLIVTYSNKFIPTADKDNQVPVGLEIVCNTADHGFWVDK